MGCDSATFQDKGTEVPSMSRDKGKTGQAQNLAKGRDGTGRDSLSKSRMGRGIGPRTGQSLFFSHNFLFSNVLSCFRTSYPISERQSLV